MSIGNLCISFLYSFVLVLIKGQSVTQADPKLTVLPGMTLSSWSFLLHFPGAWGLTGHPYSCALCQMMKGNVESGEGTALRLTHKAPNPGL